MGCLVLLGVLMAAVSCLAVFAFTGAIDAEPGSHSAAAGQPPAEPETPASMATPSSPLNGTPMATPVPAITVSPGQPVGNEAQSIHQTLEIESRGGGLRVIVRAASKTFEGERAVLAIFVRAENESTERVRIDPAYFSLVDRTGARHPISSLVVETSLAAKELGPRDAPETERIGQGIVMFEMRSAAPGLALVYEPPGAATMRFPLPPEFG